MIRIAILLLAAGSCARAAWAEDLVLGLAGPITGSSATFGEQMRHGAQLAVEDINARGGILGHRIALQVGDDGSDPKQGVAVANDLASRKTVAVVGDFNSGISIPASEVYHEEGVLQITPASTNPAFTERGFANLFRTCGRDDKQGKVAGDYLADHYAQGKIAILHDKTAYGKGLADETRKQLNARGVTEALFEAIGAGEKDYTALVSRLKNSGVDVIYLGGYHPEAGLIVRQAREAGLKAPLIGGDALATAEFWSITGAAGAGTMFTFEPDWRRAASAQELVNRFKSQGYDPEGYTLNTYAAYQVIEQAATKAKSLKLDDMVKVMRNETFETALGPIKFDAKGDLDNPKYVFYRFGIDGKYSEL